MPRQPDFFKQLNEQALEALEELARQPGTTGKDALDWLTQRNVKTSRSAVYSWLQDFRLEDRARRASEVARDYLANVQASDPNAVTEASLRKFNELVFDALTSGDELDTNDLMKLSVALKTGLGAQQLVLELKRQGREQMEKLKGVAAKRQITPQDIEAASKAVFG